jgi:hypothetical protein
VPLGLAARSTCRWRSNASSTAARICGTSAGTANLCGVTTLPHFSVYSTMNLPNSAGELANGSMPKSTSRALNAASASAELTCLLRIAVISGGVFAGAPIPTQAVAFGSGRPTSSPSKANRQRPIFHSFRYPTLAMVGSIVSVTRLWRWSGTARLVRGYWRVAGPSDAETSLIVFSNRSLERSDR